ncbi:hypothetical protein CTI12_AA268980 [Artemisia annua]|uniref:Uncharacterized protein n=1 Tax=Artemisia annua TaxID=35608 RepID=A0A2U1NGM7_ARTAN|nr:hypothetical protein CTI12_AA268980 [Artemisia annua]
MDNRGTPAPRNSMLTFVANEKTQGPSECWPFQVRYGYSDILNQSCRVHLSNRRVPENVEAPELARRNTEGENVVDENHRGAEFEQDRQLDVGTVEPLESFIRRNIVDVDLDTPALLIVGGLAGEYYEHQKEAESKAAEGNIGNGSASNPVMDLENVSSCPNEDIVVECAPIEALDAVTGNELVVYNGIGKNEADRGNGCPKVRHVKSLKINGKRKFKGKKQKMAESDVARGTFVNCSSASDDTGRNISDTEPTESRPCPRVSRSGRLLKPTPKLLQLANSTGAPAGEGISGAGEGTSRAGEGTSGAGKGTSGSERKHRKMHSLNAIIAQETSMPRIPAETKGNQHNHHQSGVVNPNGSGIGVEVSVSEPSGSMSVAGQAGQANGVARQVDMVNPDGSGVGGSGPTEPTSAAGQAGGLNAVGRQTDMVVPMLEPMVCVTNRNPMDLSIEEAKKYMRTG